MNTNMLLVSFVSLLTILAVLIDSLPVDTSTAVQNATLPAPPVLTAEAMIRRALDTKDEGFKPVEPARDPHFDAVQKMWAQSHIQTGTGNGTGNAIEAPPALTEIGTNTTSGPISV